MSDKDELGLVWKSHHALNDKLISLRAETDRLTAEVCFLQAHRNQLQVHNKNIVEKIQSLQVDNIKLEQDVAHYSEETEYLKNENERLTAEVARLKAALEKLSVKENYYIINDHGMVYIGGDYKIYYTETAGQDDYHHPADIARAALAERRMK